MEWNKKKDEAIGKISLSFFLNHALDLPADIGLFE